MEKTFNQLFCKGLLLSKAEPKEPPDSAITHISGYASVFGVQDNHNDIILKGAFGDTMPKDIKLLWQHDASKPIGIIRELKEDEYGLNIKAEINNNTRNGFEASQLIKQQALEGLSIGFYVEKSKYNQQGQRLISDLRLLEVSIVTFPANQQAKINHIKSGYWQPSEQLTDLLNTIQQLTKLEDIS